MNKYTIEIIDEAYHPPLIVGVLEIQAVSLETAYEIAKSMLDRTDYEVRIKP